MKGTIMALSEVTSQIDSARSQDLFIDSIICGLASVVFGGQTCRAMLLLAALIASLLYPSAHANAQTNSASPLGTNLDAVTYYSPEQPFLNILKTGLGWGAWDTNGTRWSEVQGAFNLDANGYPQSFSGIGPAAGRTFTEIDALVLSQLGIYQTPTSSQVAPFYPAGNYVLLYTGTATFGWSYDCLQSNVVSSAQGRIVISIPSPSSGGCLIQILSGHPASMAFVYSPDSTASVIGTLETLYNNGEIFNPTLISRISQFKTLRFMDWLQTNYTVQQNWSGRPTLSQAFWGISSSPGNVDPMPQGVPVEVLVALCNEINADGWFNMPPLSTDDYVAQFATLVHSTLNSNLKAYVEYGNEIWNNGALATFSNLTTLGYAAFPSAGNDFNAGFIYGILRAVQDGATWKSVWGADAGRVIRVVAGQDGYTARNQFILNFTAGMYGGSPSSFSGTVAQNVDTFATGVYFGYPVPDTFTLDQLFTEIMSGGLVSGGYPGGMIKQALDQATADYSVASAAGLRMVAYEAGQTLVDYSYSDSVLQTLYATANRDPRMGTAYTTFLNGWKSLGGTLFNHYYDIGPYSKWGYWGSLENVLQTSSPKYNALTSFISNNPCWWSSCATTGSSTTTPTPAVSTTAGPSTPTGLAGTLATASQINLTWTASTESGGVVAGYNVSRNGTKVGTPNTTSYSDTGLSAGTAYTYTVSAHDKAGNTSAQSSSISVSTPAPPKVTISSPSNGAVIKGYGNINIAATASDPNGVQTITIKGNSTTLLTCTSTTSCSTTWPASTLSRGTHVISVTATDKFGLQSSASVTVVDLR